MFSIYLKVLFTSLFCFSPLSAYEKPESMNSKNWDKIQSYLLPEEHSLKPALDRIFESGRPTASVEAMENAGFKIIPMHNKRKIVAHHKKLKGYVIKTYLDTHHIKSDDWWVWVHRVKGARLIQECLDRHDYNAMIKVPKKWIYPLPSGGGAGEALYPKEFILVAEDMDLADAAKNKVFYYTMGPTQMDALFVVLTENLLHDSIYVHNVPFSNDGRISFIDTEHFASKSRRIRYGYLTRYFSPAMQPYWKKLIHEGGPKTSI